MTQANRVRQVSGEQARRALVVTREWEREREREWQAQLINPLLPLPHLIYKCIFLVRRESILQYVRTVRSVFSSPASFANK